MTLWTELDLADVADALLMTSTVMLTVGLLACVGLRGVRSASTRLTR